MTTLKITDDLTININNNTIDIRDAYRIQKQCFIALGEMGMCIARLNREVEQAQINANMIAEVDIRIHKRYEEAGMLCR